MQKNKQTVAQSARDEWMMRSLGLRLAKAAKAGAGRYIAYTPGVFGLCCWSGRLGVGLCVGMAGEVEYTAERVGLGKCSPKGNESVYKAAVQSLPLCSRTPPHPAVP